MKEYVKCIYSYTGEVTVGEIYEKLEASYNTGQEDFDIIDDNGTRRKVIYEGGLWGFEDCDSEGVTKEVCLCIIRENNEVHSIGIKKGGNYYSPEGGGNFDLTRKLHLFEYREMSWSELRELIKLPE